MPLIRLSASERGGLLLPDVMLATDMSALALHMATSGISPQELPADALINLTPPQATGNAFEYWMQTGKEAPPETAVLHYMPVARNSELKVIRPGGRPTTTPERSLRLPEDSYAFPLVSPTPGSKALKVFELVMALPPELIAGLGELAHRHTPLS